jgi:hypothetical protein
MLPYTEIARSVSRFARLRDCAGGVCNVRPPLSPYFVCERVLGFASGTIAPATPAAAADGGAALPPLASCPTVLWEPRRRRIAVGRGRHRPCSAIAGHSLRCQRCRSAAAAAVKNRPAICMSTLVHGSHGAHVSTVLIQTSNARGGTQETPK